MERYLLVVVTALDFEMAVDFNACHLELTLLLQLSQSLRLLKLFFTSLPLGFLTFGVRQSSPTLLQHLLFVLIHIDGIRSARLCFRVRINFTGSQRPGVVLVSGDLALGLI